MRSPRWAVLVALAGTVALTVGLGSGQESTYDNAIRHARTIIHGYVQATGATALQVAVGVDSRIVWEEAMGLSDRVRGIAATRQSQFRIASVSKLLTGTLVAKLASSGRLDLDRPLGDDVPDFPPAWREITARQLVSHSSGIPHYRDRADALDTTYYPDTRAGLAWFRERPLVHAPGTQETYSTFAYTLLALAVEHAAGRSFPDIMRAELLHPLGMHATVPDDRRADLPARTAFYEMAPDGTITEAPPIDLSGRLAGSGYLSTASDLVRFGLAHLDGGSLPAEVRALVGQQQPLTARRRTREGFGWGPRSDWDGRRMLWGDGSTLGARGGLLVYPSDGVVVAILTNVRGLALDRGEFQLLAQLFRAARAGSPIQLPPAALSGAWDGEVRAGGASRRVRLQVGDGRGVAQFSGWRSFRILDSFRLGEFSWLVPADGGGLFPLSARLDGDSLRVTAPRAGWSFSLGRTTP